MATAVRPAPGALLSLLVLLLGLSGCAPTAVPDPTPVPTAAIVEAANLPTPRITPRPDPRPLAVQMGTAVPPYPLTPTPDPAHYALDADSAPEGPDFKIIPDSELVYGPAARDFDLAAFAAALNGYLPAYRETVEGQTLSGPEIVQLIADRTSVNPRLLLAVLEHQSGWLTQADVAESVYPLGNPAPQAAGLFRQLNWAANLLNLGYYGRAEGGLRRLTLADGTVMSFAPEINHGTAGVQQFLAAPDGVTYASWLRNVGPEGLAATYTRLFGSPFSYAVEPLLPGDLAQPPLRLPWAAGETWSFTSGPHGGWNSGSAWAALDFAPPGDALGCVPSDAWVTAMAPGIVTRSGFGAVVVALDGDYAGAGWAITYMHLETRDRVAVGTAVQTGDRLGHPSCEGGFSSGTHLHIARTYNGRWIAADGPLPFDLDGWISQGFGREYNGLLVRGDEVKTACACRGEDNAITADE